MLKATLMDSHLLGGRDTEMVEPNFKLGRVGRCPKVPSLTIALFDDSGSVAAPGGTDSIGNRYVEAKAATSKLRACRCGRCLCAVRHFDTPVGDAGPSRLKLGTTHAELELALQVPALAAGTSYIADALSSAKRLAHEHPEHAARLVIFTDWALFDPPEYIASLNSFPGTVYAVGLGANAPAEIHGDHITKLRIDTADKPGAVARALFSALVVDRPGSSR